MEELELSPQLRKSFKQSFQGLPDFKKNLTADRITYCFAEGAGIKLLYGTERVNSDILSLLYQLAEEKDVLKKMQDMQEGKFVNFIKGYESENRRALHTATRAVFSSKKYPKIVQEAIEKSKIEIDKLQKLLPQFEHFTTIVQIGIGGSSLGPETVYRGLEYFKKSHKAAYFLSNIDPDEVAKLLTVIDLKKTLFIVVSKSGSTLETLTNETWIRQKLQDLHLNPKEHFIAVTEQGSLLDDADRYQAVFYIWDYIGGRYSVTSMVGGVLLSLTLGIERYFEFLRGAFMMDHTVLEMDLNKNLPLLSALLGVWNQNFLGYSTSAIIPYCQALCRLPAYLQQLYMESNGKSITTEGKKITYSTSPVVWGEIGTNSQHSFFQFLHQGTSPASVEFIGFIHSQYYQDIKIDGTLSQDKLLSNLFAQSLALAQGQDHSNPNKSFTGNRPSRILLAKQLDPMNLGSLIAYYEHQVVFQGFLWSINSFDQEGVQLGKKLANRFLNAYQKQHQQFPLEDCLEKAYLNHLSFHEGSIVNH